MFQLDKNDYQNIVVLKRFPEFQKFVKMLEMQANLMALKCMAEKDDTAAKWLQGRVQELLDVIGKVKKADDELKAYNISYPKGDVG